MTLDLREIRVRLGLSLREVGERMGVSMQRVQELESGKSCNVDTFVRWAKALGYTLELKR